MNQGLSDEVRKKARAKYVQPALRAGKPELSIAVKDLLEDLIEDGFPARNVPQVCTALKSGKFLRDNGLSIIGVDGPPSGMSTTVVVRYRVGGANMEANAKKSPQNAKEFSSAEEAPVEKAKRLTEKLRGLLKQELAEYGGGEAFLQWVRSEDEKDIA
jgi:hypothetical protein